MQAVQTNIIGTDNVLHAAIDAGVKRVVCLSTDKAAYPINAMGISKAMMEHVIYANARVAAERGGTTICCTRYGNVMCSRGSVIPLFIDQIKAGSPITITDPNMTRFLMNLDEAVELARLMVSIGTAHGRKVAALITDMDTPLGHNIGNSLEVAESMAVLQGKGPADLTEVCLQLASNMLYLAGKGEMAACRAMAEQVIADGSAFEICCKMFAAQGGDTSVLRDASLFRKAKYAHDICAPADGLSLIHI